jgi:hypothetical protein
MELKGILAISGKPGLYKLVSQTKTGLIVESLDDGKRFPVYAAHQISALEEISLFTYEDDLALADAFKMIYENLNGEKAPSPKSSSKDLEKFMSEAIPEYDEERVYVSDIKKLVRWYNQLLEKGIIKFEEESSEESQEKEATDDKSEEKSED